jgi:hypothetical protein
MHKVSLWALLFLFATAGVFAGQSMRSGTITGTVRDQSGAVVPGAGVVLKNAITGYTQSAVTNDRGSFRLTNIPENPYQLTVAAEGFDPYTRQVDVRSAQPIGLQIQLKLQTASFSVSVESNALVENTPSAHQDVNSTSIENLPLSDPGAQLSQAITYSTGAVAADANGFFHPLGDHSQTTFVIDGQPISDQQSKIFSTQIPANALQSMQLITGMPDVRYGDKTSLVVDAAAKSGLGARKPFGSIESQWGSFGTWGGSASLGMGGPAWGNFIVANGLRTGRFLDTPEFLPIHDIGNNENIFDRFDWQPSAVNALHLDLFAARNWFQTPNSLDQLPQDQRQRVLTWNIAPGYQHVFSPRMLLTVNPYARRDQVNYYPSANPFADTPITASQNRFLTNYGFTADLSYATRRHQIDIGTELQQTRLLENFAFGITDPNYLDPALQPGLVPYDLTRGGAMFHFHGAHNVNQYAVYLSDTIRLGNFTINAGLRDDQYNGLTSANGVQPRIGVAYLIPSINTVLRASYARTFETPFNENLILSSGAGAGGLAQNVFGSVSTPIRPGRRNQFDTGLEKRFGRWLIADADYFWKYTDNAYDFSVLFNTPITFPIAWRNSKLDGFSARLSTIDLHGFQAYTTLGHTRARYFPPEVGGLIPLGGFPGNVFRIDHDQAYQQTTALRYQRPHNREWIDFTWRYDSGMVVSGVPDVAAALQLTAAQQVAIGFACNGVPATYAAPITTCNGVGTSALLTLPQTGTENDDHNPDRVKPRNLFDIGIGTDDLFHSNEPQRITLKFTVENLTNKVALYNFLSTFSGTHFVAPRTYRLAIGYVF